MGVASVVVAKQVVVSLDSVVMIVAACWSGCSGNGGCCASCGCHCRNLAVALVAAVLLP